MLPVLPKVYRWYSANPFWPIPSTGKMISSIEAFEIGIVNKVVSSESLMEEVLKTAGMIASKGKISIRAAKQAINNGMNS